MQNIVGILTNQSFPQSAEILPQRGVETFPIPQCPKSTRICLIPYYTFPDENGHTIGKNWVGSLFHSKTIAVSNKRY